MRCRFCGYEGSEDDFEEDYIHHLGYWCPYCDAFSYISDENEKRRQFLLWLEDIKNGQPLTEKRYSNKTYPRCGIQEEKPSWYHM